MEMTRKWVVQSRNIVLELATEKTHERAHRFYEKLGYLRGRAFYRIVAVPRASIPGHRSQIFGLCVEIRNNTIAPLSNLEILNHGRSRLEFSVFSYFSIASQV